MANIRKRGDSYQIRVSLGYDTKGNQIFRHCRSIWVTA